MGEHHRERIHEVDSLDHRVVQEADRREVIAPHPGDRVDLLDDDRAGDDREARIRRLHRPLQARPRARRRDGPSGRGGPPPPRDLALGPRRRERALLRRGRGEDDCPVPEGIRDAGQGNRSVAPPLHGPLGRAAADGGVHHLRDRLRPRGQGGPARNQARVPVLARCPPLRLPGVQRAAPVRRAPQPVHLAAATLRRLRPVGQRVRRPGPRRSRATGSTSATELRR